MPQRPPHRVRSFLRQEIPGWRAEGILSSGAERMLEERYGLTEDDSSGLAVAALYVLAACLVGGGVVSLVAWHWDDMSRWSRLLILGAAVVAAHLAGFRMWKVTGRPRLGHAVSLLGTILFGASIALVAQIFQVSGPWYGAFGAWAIGAAVAGVVLPNTPALCLACFLATFVWGPGFISAHERLGDLVAWLAGGAALILALRSRSRVAYLVSAGGLGLLLAMAASSPDGRASSLVMVTGLAAIAAVCAAGALSPDGAAGRLAPTSAWLGRAALYLLAYELSFKGIAKYVVEDRWAWSRFWLTCALPAALIALALLVAALRSARGSVPLRLTAALAAAFVPLFLAATRAHDHPLVLAALANAILLAVAAAWIAHGMAAQARLPFWEGLGVAAVVAVSRFFEIEKLLWLKGTGFIACGVGVVLAALFFERRLQGRAAEVRHA